jgi:hypothetical protein
MTQQEIESLWVQDALSVAFRFSDSVRVINGEDSGKTGRDRSALKLEPYPTYVIELKDGSSAVAIEPDLESWRNNQKPIPSDLE